MKKIVFGITSLGLGGAERVLVDICNELVKKYDITILTLYPNGEFEPQLDKKVKINSIYDKEYNNFNKLSKIKISMDMLSKAKRKQIYDKYIRNKYDVVIAFLEGPITWIFSEDDNVRKIVWVHNDIASVFGKGKKAKAKQKLNEECYKKFDEIVFVSKQNLDIFKDYFKDNNVNKRVIYNYLDYDLVLKKAEKEEAPEIDKTSISFVQVSRLVEQKAIMRLLLAHNKLIKDGYKHKIYIVGDGDLREEIQNKIDELKLNDSFILLGKKTNPYPYVKKGNYFMLTSYYEGYPLVLLEAKALNKFIMITDSASRETLIGYNNSLIVDNNEQGIYDGIKKICNNEIKQVKVKDNSNKEIIKSIIDLVEGE